jgi:hypothetical protein
VILLLSVQQVLKAEEALVLRWLVIIPCTRSPEVKSSAPRKLYRRRVDRRAKCGDEGANFVIIISVTPPSSIITSRVSPDAYTDQVR